MIVLTAFLFGCAFYAGKIRSRSSVTGSGGNTGGISASLMMAIDADALLGDPICAESAGFHESQNDYCLTCGVATDEDEIGDGFCLLRNLVTKYVLGLYKISYSLMIDFDDDVVTDDRIFAQSMGFYESNEDYCLTCGVATDDDGIGDGFCLLRNLVTRKVLGLYKISV